MRKVAIILATVLIAGTAHAADNSDGWGFGGAACNSPTNCDVLRENIENVISIANQCVLSKLSLGSGEESAFEDSRGLDSSDCLTSKTRTKSTQGRTIVPRCCVVKAKDDLCQVVCASIGIR